MEQSLAGFADAVKKKLGATNEAAASKTSLEIKNGRVEASLSKCTKFEQFQFERNGYFCYDRDSTNEKPVFNLTIGLKEDKGK